MVPTIGSLFGKNSSPNTSAAAVPYRKKSYHSSADPMQAAKITRKRGELVLTAELSVMVSPPVFCCHCFVVLKCGQKRNARVGARVFQEIRLLW